MPSLVAFLISLAVLALLVAAGVGAIMALRRWWLTSGDDRGDWAKMLSEYKNLRDDGVLGEQEYRKIRTLVEPRLRGGAAECGGRQRPTVDSGNSDHKGK